MQGRLVHGGTVSDKCVFSVEKSQFYSFIHRFQCISLNHILHRSGARVQWRGFIRSFEPQLDRTLLCVSVSVCVCAKITGKLQLSASSFPITSSPPRPPHACLSTVWLPCVSVSLREPPQSWVMVGEIEGATGQMRNHIRHNMCGCVNGPCTLW